ncbi:MAG: MBL fold metallo-hydrolase [Devosia sp.]
MAEALSPLSFDTRFRTETGVAVDILPGVQRITAPNGGPFTFTGTNSFILGHNRVAVLDPGPNDSGHLEALLRAIGGRKLEAIILTHTHIDHSALAPRLKAATGAPLWFAGRHRLSRKRRPFEINLVARGSDWSIRPDRVIADGERIEAGDLGLIGMATPGHCANHMAFGIEGTDWLLTGDHIMGWNSTLVPVPDGSMADYLHSLEKAIAAPYAHYLPAHGGPIAEGPAFARALLQHRLLRNRQIVDAVNKGATTIGALMKVVYPVLPPGVRIGAWMTLTAHADYLGERGEIRVKRGLFGWRISHI